MVDFAPRDGFSVVEAATLHARMTFAGSLSHQPRIKPTSAADAEASGGPGAFRRNGAGAAAVSKCCCRGGYFNKEICQDIGFCDGLGGPGWGGTLEDYVGKSSADSIGVPANAEGKGG